MVVVGLCFEARLFIVSTSYVVGPILFQASTGFGVAFPILAVS